VAKNFTEQLDRSQEAFDLRRAVWAGFVKSRFWRTARWIESHATVDTIIYFATLLFVGLFLCSVFLQKRLPNPTGLCVFYATVGALSFGYVVHRNQGLLRRVWENPWGKLLYGLVASATVTACKVLTDQQIRMLTQSNPSLFSSAQQQSQY
jgi:peptidoglycan/LPS O-acetylase OafA/YrhL